MNIQIVYISWDLAVHLYMENVRIGNILSQQYGIMNIDISVIHKVYFNVYSCIKIRKLKISFILFLRRLFTIMF